MALVRIHNVTKQFNAQIVLRDVTLELMEGEVAGLVGPNGAGKTTLLRLVAGVIDPDLGTVTRAKGLDVGYLPQEPQVDPNRTLHDEVGCALADLLDMEHKLHELSDRMADRHDTGRLDDVMRQYDRLNARFEAAGGYGFVQRLNEVLGGLGFSQADHNLPMSAMSGGQKCRAALAKLLLRDQRYLLLDEPTNHLDIDAVRWLERFLSTHRGGALIVSHDRYLLDRLVDRVVEVERMRVSSFPGNYSNYVSTKEIRLLTQERQFEKDQTFIEKERDFIARHLAGQRTKEAQGRRTRLERRIRDGEFVLDKPTERKRAKFKFDPVESRGGAVLRVDDLSKRFDEKVLFTDLRFQVHPGERFGITGPNGTGKSTLLKIILGHIRADDGKIEFGPKLTPGYYAQESSELNPARNVLEEMREACPHMSEEEARSYLGRFLFSGDDVFKPVGKLSGGEQSRVRLIKLIVSNPNLLVLDEPTNHLDIASCEALEEALSEFPGTILVVSHDRYFIDRIVDRLLVIRPEGWGVFAGNYSYYIEEIERRATAEQAERKAPDKKKNDRPKPAAPRKTVSKSSRYDALSIEQIEEVIVQRETRIAELNQQFAEPSVYRDAAAMASLRAELDVVRRELDEAEQEWNDRTIE